MHRQIKLRRPRSHMSQCTAHYARSRKYQRCLHRSWSSYQCERNICLCVISSSDAHGDTVMSVCLFTLAACRANAQRHAHVHANATLPVWPSYYMVFTLGASTRLFFQTLALIWPNCYIIIVIKVIVCTLPAWMWTISKIWSMVCVDKYLPQLPC